MTKEYFYIDIDLKSLQIVEHGTCPAASHTGEPVKVGVYRVYLTRGQYHKLVSALK